MQSELHGNVIHHGVELLLLVSMLFLPAIPKCLLILKDFLYTSYDNAIAHSWQLQLCHVYAHVPVHCATHLHNAGFTYMMLAHYKQACTHHRIPHCHCYAIVARLSSVHRAEKSAIGGLPC